mmetsp:Transcript_53385/g.114764  ORF Transcript_53385/g.114764 Transcript_53385/m.114764 type:complete len:996 (-) Transcript_53385:38-3025(-)
MGNARSSRVEGAETLSVRPTATSQDGSGTPRTETPSASFAQTNKHHFLAEHGRTLLPESHIDFGEELNAIFTKLDELRATAQAMPEGRPHAGAEGEVQAPTEKLWQGPEESSQQYLESQEDPASPVEETKMWMERAKRAEIDAAAQAQSLLKVQARCETFEELAERGEAFISLMAGKIRRAEANSTQKAVALTEELERSVTQCQELKEEVECARARCEELEGLVHAGEASTKQMASKVEEEKTQCDRLRDDMASMEVDVVAQAEALHRSMARCEQLQLQADQSMALLAAKDAQGEGERCVELEGFVLRAEAEVVVKAEELRVSREQCSNWKERAESGESDARVQAEKLQEVEAHVEELVEELTNAKALCFELKERAEHSEQEVAKGSEDLEVAKRRCVELEGLVEKAEAEATRNKIVADAGAAEFRLSVSRCCELKERAERAEKEVATVSQDLEIAKRRCNELEGFMEQAEAEAARNKAEVASRAHEGFQELERAKMRRTDVVAKVEALQKSAELCSDWKKRALRAESDVLVQTEELERMEVRCRELKASADSSEELAQLSKAEAAKVAEELNQAKSRCLELECLTAGASAGHPQDGEQRSAVIKSLKDCLAHREEDIARRCEELQKAKAQNAQLTMGLQAAQAQAEETALSNVADLQKALARCCELKERAERSEGEKAKSIEELQLAQARNADLEDLLARAVTQAETARRCVARREADVAAKAAEVHSARKQCLALGRLASGETGIAGESAEELQDVEVLLKQQEERADFAEAEASARAEELVVSATECSRVKSMLQDARSEMERLRADAAANAEESQRVVERNRLLEAQARAMNLLPRSPERTLVKDMSPKRLCRSLLEDVAQARLALHDQEAATERDSQPSLQSPPLAPRLGTASAPRLAPASSTGQLDAPQSPMAGPRSLVTGPQSPLPARSPFREISAPRSPPPLFRQTSVPQSPPPLQGLGNESFPSSPSAMVGSFLIPWGSVKMASGR